MFSVAGLIAIVYARVKEYFKDKTYLLFSKQGNRGGGKESKWSLLQYETHQKFTSLKCTISMDLHSLKIFSLSVWGVLAHIRKHSSQALFCYQIPCMYFALMMDFDGLYYV